MSPFLAKSAVESPESWCHWGAVVEGMGFKPFHSCHALLSQSYYLLKWALIKCQYCVGDIHKATGMWERAESLLSQQCHFPLMLI